MFAIALIFIGVKGGEMNMLLTVALAWYATFETFKTLSE